MGRYGALSDWELARIETVRAGVEAHYDNLWIDFLLTLSHIDHFLLSPNGSHVQGRLFIILTVASPFPPNKSPKKDKDDQAMQEKKEKKEKTEKEEEKERKEKKSKKGKEKVKEKKEKIRKERKEGKEEGSLQSRPFPCPKAKKNSDALNELLFINIHPTIHYSVLSPWCLSYTITLPRPGRC